MKPEHEVVAVCVVVYEAREPVGRRANEATLGPLLAGGGEGLRPLRQRLVQAPQDRAEDLVVVGQQDLDHVGQLVLAAVVEPGLPGEGLGICNWCLFTFCIRKLTCYFFTG